MHFETISNKDLYYLDVMLSISLEMELFLIFIDQIYFLCKLYPQ